MFRISCVFLMMFIWSMVDVLSLLSSWFNGLLCCDSLMLCGKSCCMNDSMLVCISVWCYLLLIWLIMVVVVICDCDGILCNLGSGVCKVRFGLLLGLVMLVFMLVLMCMLIFVCYFGNWYLYSLCICVIFVVIGSVRICVWKLWCCMEVSSFGVWGFCVFGWWIIIVMEILL